MTGIAEAIISSSIRGTSMGYLRAMRLLRISRILRIVRAIQSLRELRQMAACVVGSMLSLVWAVLFLFLMLMMTSLVFVQRMTEFRLHECKGDGNDHDTCGLIYKWFGTV